MKPRVIVAATVIIAFFNASAQELRIQGQDQKAIALISVGAADTNLFSRVRDYVEFNYAMGVRVVPGRARSEKTLEIEREVLAASLGQHDVCLLALAFDASVMKSRVAVDLRERVGMLSVSAFRPDQAGGVDIRETHARRLEKESMRLIGLMLGLAPCLFPRCAMCDSHNDEDLDSRGRNLCPACYGKAQDLLAKKGVPPLDARVLPHVAPVIQQGK